MQQNQLMVGHFTDINMLETMFVWCTPFIFFVHFLNVFFENIRVGVIISIYIFLLFAIFCKKIKKHYLNIYIIIYILWSFLSVYAYLFNQLPTIIFFKQLSSSCLPIALYFLGRRFFYIKDRFYNMFLISCVFCFLFGLYWNYALPNYYLSYLSRIITWFNINYFLNHPRFNSFIGSTGVGVLFSISYLISLEKIGKHNELKYFLTMIISIIAVTFSMQRSAYLNFLFISLYFIVRNSNYRKKIISRLFLFFLLALPFYNFIGWDGIIDKIISVPNAVSERAGQWANLHDIGLYIITGYGLGAMSHKALPYSDLLITDGAYLTIMGEQGIIGILLLLVIILLTYCKILRFKLLDECIIESLIILIFLISSFGSNTILFLSISPFFWLSIGIIHEISFLKYKGKI
ncbi:hypothetical protein LJC40_01395 [Synergistaceae bacterium OttesenSCG-928-D05]|nr:hypothetical protein [Synergistaceae bacterium OttesenSCG-928-D05]